MSDPTTPPAKEQEEEGMKKTKKGASERCYSKLNHFSYFATGAVSELKDMLVEAIEGNTLPTFSKEDDELILWGVPLTVSDDDGTYTFTAAANSILFKFLSVCDFKCDRTLDKIKRTLQWRKEVEYPILDADLDAKLGTGFLSGEELVDYEGRPVCYNICKFFKTPFADPSFSEITAPFPSAEDRKKVLKWRVLMMEKGIRELNLVSPRGVSHMIQVIDVSCCCFNPLQDFIDIFKEQFLFFDDNYPLITSEIIIVKVPRRKDVGDRGDIFEEFLRTLGQKMYQKRVGVHRATTVDTTDLLLKFIRPDALPYQYGGLWRENDSDFWAGDDSTVLKLLVGQDGTLTIDIDAPKVGTTVIWDVQIVRFIFVLFREEFVPADGTDSITLLEGNELRDGLRWKQLWGGQGIRTMFTIKKPGKIVLTIYNDNTRAKWVLYRYKTRSS